MTNRKSVRKAVPLEIMLLPWYISENTKNGADATHPSAIALIWGPKHSFLVLKNKNHIVQVNSEP